MRAVGLMTLRAARARPDGSERLGAGQVVFQEAYGGYDFLRRRVLYEDGVEPVGVDLRRAASAR
jgi:hypothetical protein